MFHVISILCSRVRASCNLTFPFRPASSPARIHLTVASHRCRHLTHPSQARSVFTRRARTFPRHCPKKPLPSCLKLFRSRRPRVRIPVAGVEQVCNVAQSLHDGREILIQNCALFAGHRMVLHFVLILNEACPVRFGFVERIGIRPQTNNRPDGRELLLALWQPFLYFSLGCKYLTLRRLPGLLANVRQSCKTTLSSER